MTAFLKRTSLILLALTVIAGLSPMSAEAQRRHGGGEHGARGVVVIGGGYIGGYWGPWGPWGPWWYPPYPYYPPYYYGDRDDSAHLKTEVKPKQTRVYVDGYYAGVADDFDGVFQSLRVRPGPHDVTLYLEGYQTVTQRVYFSPDGTTKLQHVMAPLAPGQPMQPPPAPPSPPPGSVTAQPARPGQPGEPGTEPPGPPSEMPPPMRAPAGSMAAGFGTLSIRVQPADATILIDGEQWVGPADSDRLTVQVAEGAHHIDIRKSGYRPFSIEVQVQPGATVPLNVSLPPLH
jgi:PEGA domain